MSRSNAIVRLHALEHVDFEDAANIEVWARERGHAVSRTLLHRNVPPPALSSFDWLVIMGGPMNIHEEEAHPWLRGEKRFIRRVIDAGIPVLGVCLGAQLVADVLGGRVTRNAHREIGWFPVTLTEAARSSPPFAALPSPFTAFHWHGDTFAIPPGAERMARSEACENQAFCYGKNVVGLQFHLDYHLESIRRMIASCAHELTPGPYTHTEPERLADSVRTTTAEKLLYRLLDACVAEFFGA